MKIDTENKEPIKEPRKEPIKEPRKEPIKEPRKEPIKEPRKEPKNENKEHLSVVKNFIGKDITITLRNDNKIKGKLETVSQYELVITVSYSPIIVMKHAIDYIELTGEK